MYVILGASGNTGSTAAQALLDRGKKVRVVARNPEHLRSLTERGAEPAVLDVTETAKLTRALDAAEAAYVMIPPNPATPDLYAYDEQVISSIVAALKETKVPFAVSLSSVGADKESGTGPVLGLRRFEQALNKIDGLKTLHLRPGYFMENTLGQAQIIKRMGAVAGPIRPDLKLPMIATRDIGAVIADALIALDFKGQETRELLGQRDISYNEVASILGNAVGKPSLEYVQLPDNQLRPAMISMGMSGSFVDLLLEMCAALNSGYMQPLESRSPRNSTPTSFEQFAADRFLPEYRKLGAAA